MIIEHIVDQIWAQYDCDNSGALDQLESKAFMRVVLEHHEATIAKLLKIKPTDVSEEHILNAIEICDKDQNGLITKSELNSWLIKIMEKEYHVKHIANHKGDHTGDSEIEDHDC